MGTKILKKMFAVVKQTISLIEYSSTGCQVIILKSCSREFMLLHDTPQLERRIENESNVRVNFLHNLFQIKQILLTFDVIL